VSLEAVFAAYPPLLPNDVTFVGPDKRNEQARPPRISWNPKRARHLDPRETGVVITRQWEIDVEIWGTSLTETEALVHAFIATTHDLCSRFSYGLGDEDWNTGGVSAEGCLCSLTMRLKVPVLKTEYPSIPVTAAAPSFTMGNTQV
jgi:hypothetical protein